MEQYLHRSRQELLHALRALREFVDSYAFDHTARERARELDSRAVLAIDALCEVASDGLVKCPVCRGSRGVSVATLDPLLEPCGACFATGTAPVRYPDRVHARDAVVIALGMYADVSHRIDALSVSQRNTMRELVGRGVRALDALWDMAARQPVRLTQDEYECACWIDNHPYQWKSWQGHPAFEKMRARGWIGIGSTFLGDRATTFSPLPSSVRYHALRLRNGWDPKWRKEKRE